MSSAACAWPTAHAVGCQCRLDPGPVPLSQTPLAASVQRDQQNEKLLRHNPVQTLRQLAMLAIDVALDCPLDKPGRPGYYTYVSRDTVREIRAVLEQAGVPWKQQHKEIRRK